MPALAVGAVHAPLQGKPDALGGQAAPQALARAGQHQRLRAAAQQRVHAACGEQSIEMVQGRTGSLARRWLIEALEQGQHGAPACPFPAQHLGCGVTRAVQQRQTPGRTRRAGVLDQSSQRRQAATTRHRQHPATRRQVLRPAVTERAAIAQQRTRRAGEQRAGHPPHPAHQRAEAAVRTGRPHIGERRLTDAGHAEHEELPGAHGGIAGVRSVQAKGEVAGVLAVRIAMLKPQSARRRVDHGFATRPMTPWTPMPPGQTRSQRPQPTQP